MRRLQKVFTVLVLMAFASSCTSRDGIGTVSGIVTVGGERVDSGTIHFQPTDNAKSKGAGALIEAGRFTLVENESISAGTYKVVIQAFAKTGRIVNDPQKGDVPEMTAIPIVNMPKEVSLTPDNYRDLQIDFERAGN